MPQLAGFRGALWDPSKVDLAKVATGEITNVKDRLARGELVRDATRALYRYHQTFTLDGRAVTRKTLLGAVRLSPWSEGTIRPHESTDPAARELAIQSITREGAHTEAVFAGYRDAAGEVDRLMRGVETGRPALELKTPDGTHHQLWRVSSAEVIGKVRPLFAPKKLHVLDGHARYEGMLAYHERLAQKPLLQYSSANYGLACLVNVAEPALIVGPRHRMVQGEVDRAAVLEAAKRWFIVEKLATRDVAKLQAALADTVAHQPAFVCVFGGEDGAWKLTLSPDVSPVAEGVAVHRALQKYDPIVLEHLFLARCAGGASSRTELDPAAVVKAPFGIITRAVTLDQVLHADELGQVLPFGSTVFPPALANLAVLLIDPDEDLV